jgi:hypothetical protein
VEAMSDDLFERLAAIEHERWAHWQSYCHSCCSHTERGDLIIPKTFVDQWERQIHTEYAQLSEKEKDSDREEVMRYWPEIERLRDEIERLRAELAEEKIAYQNMCAIAGLWKHKHQRGEQ